MAALRLRILSALMPPSGPSERERLEALVAAARVLIDLAEVIHPDNTYCGDCGNIPDDHGGHADGCKVAAYLAALAEYKGGE